jgi:hypothetical protein
MTKWPAPVIRLYLDQLTPAPRKIPTTTLRRAGLRSKFLHWRTRLAARQQRRGGPTIRSRCHGLPERVQRICRRHRRTQGASRNAIKSLAANRAAPMLALSGRACPGSNRRCRSNWNRSGTSHLCCAARGSNIVKVSRRRPSRKQSYTHAAGVWKPPRDETERKGTYLRSRRQRATPTARAV